MHPQMLLIFFNKKISWGAWVAPNATFEYNLLHEQAKEKSYDHINRCRKSICQYPTLIYDLKNVYICVSLYIMVEDWRDVFCLGSGARQGRLLLPLLFNNEVLLHTYQNG